MGDPTCIHPLALKNRPSGKIKFVHSDGQEHSYYSVINSMTGDRLSAFDNNAPTIGNTLGEVSKIFANIRAKAKQIVSVVGDF